MIAEAKPHTNSRDVAAFFSKGHRHVLRDVRELLGHRPDLGDVCFQEVSTAHAHIPRRLDPSFNMDRDGFALLVMGFTGAAALDFKIAYLRRFREMEDELQAAQPQAPSGQPPVAAVVECLADIANALQRLPGGWGLAYGPQFAVGSWLSSMRGSLPIASAKVLTVTSP